MLGLCLAYPYNAFLQGSLKEEVFMAQPHGMEYQQHVQYVCKLHKEIHGLRQVTRALHDALKYFTTSHNFHMRQNDPSLFIYASRSILAYFLMYVDDLLLRGNDSKFITSLIISISNRFSLKNMGTPHYFLGVELILTVTDMFRSQHKFILILVKSLKYKESNSLPHLYLK